MTAEPNFEGHEGRDCGDHRTLGQRAWCGDCSEYCYPDQPCAGCERPKLREVEGAARRLDAAWSRAIDAMDDDNIVPTDLWFAWMAAHRDMRNALKALGEA